MVGSKQVVMDTSMRIVNGRAFVPVRFVSAAQFPIDAQQFRKAGFKEQRT